MTCNVRVSINTHLLHGILLHRPSSKSWVYFCPFHGLFCGSNERRHLQTIEENILGYINSHKKHNLNVCVFLPSKGTGYCMMSVHTVSTIDQEACGHLKGVIQLSVRI